MSSTEPPRAIVGRPGSRLGRLLGNGLEPIAPLAGGPLGKLPADAAAEAWAAQARMTGNAVRWEPPVTVGGVAALLDLCRDRGRDSVRLWRANPALLGALQLGSWFDAPWRTRMLRRAPGAGRLAAALALASPKLLALAADLAFWSAARTAASAGEWRRLAESSYVALVYHRFAGELKPGQERIDIAPERFARQLRVLRLTGFRPLPLEALLSFHDGERADLPRRRVAITVDDAIADAIEPLRRHASWAPQLFVPSAEAGRAAHWIDGEPVAEWDEIADLAAAGVAIGSHSRHHRRLTGLDATELEEELAGSLAELRARIPEAASVLAYPNGDHDDAVCAATRAAGYRAAFTTEKGRNGAGADPYRLRRVSVHGDDGSLAVLWKATTGQALPRLWLRLRGPRRR